MNAAAFKGYALMKISAKQSSILALCLQPPAKKKKRKGHKIALVGSTCLEKKSRNKNQDYQCPL